MSSIFLTLNAYGIWQKGKTWVEILRTPIMFSLSKLCDSLSSASCEKMTIFGIPKTDSWPICKLQLKTFHLVGNSGLRTPKMMASMNVTTFIWLQCDTVCFKQATNCTLRGSLKCTSNVNALHFEYDSCFKDPIHFYDSLHLHLTLKLTSINLMKSGFRASP